MQELSFFDSHAHYFDDRFYGEENPDGAEALLTELFDGGLLGVINIGTNPNSSRLALEQAKKFDRMYAAVGIHPTDMRDMDMPIDAALASIKELATDPSKKVVAIGEIGLDYYWEPYDKDAQKKCFEAQLELARELSLPVIIHDREAHGDCFETGKRSLSQLQRKSRDGKGACEKRLVYFFFRSGVVQECR